MHARSDAARFTISVRLRRALDQRTTRLESLARLAGTDGPQVSRLIHGAPFGARKFPLIERLAAIFGLTLDEAIRRRQR